MTQERRNPIPAGRYWLDLSAQGAERFGQWRDMYTGYVQIESVQRSEDSGREFVLFNVLLPSPRWPDSFGLGFPSVAPPNVRGLSDVLATPKPTMKQWWDFDLSDLGTPLVVIGLLWFMSKKSGGR